MVWVLGACVCVCQAYGEDLCAARHIAAAQSLSGTGALRVAAEWLHLYFKGNPVVYLPQPTWCGHKQKTDNEATNPGGHCVHGKWAIHLCYGRSNHPAIFHKAGLQTRTYRYFDNRTKARRQAGRLAGRRKT